MKVLKVFLLLHTLVGGASAFVCAGRFRQPLHSVVLVYSTTTNTENTNSDNPKVVEVTANDNNNNPRLEGLALLLDDGTRKSHSIAQNTAFVTGFFKGLGTRDSYRTLMTSLYFVYTAMETAFDETSDPSVQALDYDPALRRVSSIQEDLDYFYKEDISWKNHHLRPSPATQAYVARVQEVARTKPYLLVAHQYTRYLGDLFGGQMMGGMAARSLNLPKNGKGVAFYTFDDISTKDFIQDFYTRLNQLDLTETQKQEIVKEANYVFDLNIAILFELEGSPFRAIWTLTINTLKQYWLA